MLAASQGQIGFGKVVGALIAGGVSSYVMNWFSLHGVNFEMSGIIPGVTVSSEVVKSVINSTIEGAVVWLTPQHFIAAITDSIRWLRSAKKQITDAARDPLPPQG
jgi:hypothetical protein